MKYVLAALFCLPLASAEAAPAMLGYYYEPASLVSAQAETGVLGGIAADVFSISATGKISGAAPAKLLKLAGSGHMALYATVSNYAGNGFSAAIARAILAPGSIQTTAIAAIAALAGKSYAGINIDFESVPHGLRPQYTGFVQTLAAALHAKGKRLMLSIPAVSADDPNDSWAGAYDQPVLGQYADTLQIMAYDENGPWGTPGPVAGLDWVTACFSYSATIAAPGKLSLGMPAYGYDWNTTKGGGRTVYWAQIPALIAATGAQPHWDSATSSPWFTYTDAHGAAHMVWYENAQSIALKAKLAATANAASVSVWALGLEDPSYWAAISAGFAAAATE